MDPSVLENGAVGHSVSVVHGHAQLFNFFGALEHARLVHVIPDAIHVVGAAINGRMEQTFVVVLRVRVQEVVPDGLARPALSNPRLLCQRILNERAHCFTSLSFLAIHRESFFVDEVALVCVDVRVVNDNKATIFFLNLLIHLHHFVLRETKTVKLEIALVLGEFDVEPEDVNGVVMLAEVLIAVHDHLGRVVFPLGEVVTERVKRGHRRVPSQLRQLLLQVFGGFTRAKQVEFKGVSLGEERGGQMPSVVRVIYKYKSFG